MDLFYKMPLKISKAARFFCNISNTILRDFHEIIVMSKKHKFAMHTFKDFYAQAEEITDVVMFFDGEENFKRGMNLFALTAIEQETILVYEPFSGVYYWGTTEEFFINKIRCKDYQTHPESRVATTNIVPISLQISWFMTGGIDGFHCDDERFFEFLKNIPNKETLFFR